MSRRAPQWLGPVRGQYEVRYGRSDTGSGEWRARQATAGQTTTLCNPIDSARPAIFVMVSVRSSRNTRDPPRGREGGGRTTTEGQLALGGISRLPHTVACVGHELPARLRGVHEGSVFQWQYHERSFASSTTRRVGDCSLVWEDRKGSNGVGLQDLPTTPTTWLGVSQVGIEIHG